MRSILQTSVLSGWERSRTPARNDDLKASRMLIEAKVVRGLSSWEKDTLLLVCQTTEAGAQA